MTTDIGAANAPYNTKIPRLDENADIQAALRIYHYGEDTSDPDPINPNSIAGFLDDLENSKLSKNAVALPSTSHNLNTYQSAGYYVQQSNESGDMWSNYPMSPGTKGSLFVTVDGPIVYQTYHSAQSNDLFWRALVGTWSSWKQGQKLITGAATSILYDPLDPNMVMVTDGSGKVSVSTSVTATELSNLNGTSGIVPSLAGTVGGDGSSKKFFIQALEPNNTNNSGYVPQNGDLWFW